jgi:uncharacterized protein (TIGR00251 family)
LSVTEATLALQLSTTREGAVRFEVQAKPRAKVSRVVGERQGALVVQLAAPPVDGAANAELVATLASVLGVPKRDVTLVRGEASRAKVLEVRGLTAELVRERLARVMG